MLIGVLIMAFLWVPDGTSFLKAVKRGLGIRLYGATSGAVGLKSAAIAGTTDYILPSGAPVSPSVLQSDSAGNLSWVSQVGGLTQYTATSSTLTVGQSLTVTHASDVSPYRRIPQFLFAPQTPLFLSHFDGTNGQTTFSDDVGATTLTARGSAKVSTANQQFGTGSLSLTQAGTTDYVSLGSPSWANFGSANFTIECWVYLTRLNGTGVDTIIAGGRGITTAVNNCLLMVISGRLAFYATSNNSVWDIATLTDGTAFLLNTWQHVAVCRNGNNWLLARNGSIVATSTSSSSITSPVTTTTIGANADGSNAMVGFIDEMRISTAPLYVASYLPSTSALTLLPIYAPMLIGNSYVNTATSNIVAAAYTSATTTTFSLPANWTYGPIQAIASVLR